MKPRFTMREALADPKLLGAMMPGPSWSVWRSLLIASRGERLTPDELALFTARTGRAETPTEPVSEAAFIAGRRSGKTVSAACYAVYVAALCDYRSVLTGGERGVMLFLAQSQRTAKVAFQYASWLFDEVPLLRQLVTNRTQDTISLSTGVDLEIRPASFRGLRGITAVGVIADELAYWYGDDSANPDVEILAAVRPALATTGGPLLMISSPYARRGELWETFRKHHGPDGDPGILVAQGASRDFNETLLQSVVDQALERDPERYRAEYLGLFRDDVQAFISVQAVRACIDVGVRERPPERDRRYFGFVDPSGGSSDSMTLAVAHREGTTAVLDAVREVRPPFNPEAVVSEFAALLRKYRITSVRGDRYGAEWVAGQFRSAGVDYQPAERTKSELYTDVLPAINSGAVALLDSDRLVSQLTALDRRAGRSGKDVVDHPPGSHDDLANAVAGALVLAASKAAGPMPEWMQQDVALGRASYVEPDVDPLAPWDVVEPKPKIRTRRANEWRWNERPQWSTVAADDDPLADF